tara:strand:+ start:322 stop:948 length:627 start_codon:yes stop_codon:yes gene_type:complete
MSEIQNKLDSLQPYIVGIRYIQGLQVVDAVFKDGWTVPESDIIRKELVEEGKNYYMFYTEKEKVTFDDLLEYVEGIITINIEKENKEELFKIKVKELQEVFKKSSLKKLSTLKFNFSEVEKLPTLDENIEIKLNEDAKDSDSESIEETTSHTTVSVNNEDTNTTKIKGQNIELPPKIEKIELEEYSSNVVCKCDDDEVCPICEEAKFG